MATVTPNFNWPVPTSTDLVKDGATAIEALGDSIDASLVDLKGGTTGQVLAKASGTDMDFAWVAQDDSNAIQNTIVDAKGDLIAATAADTPARLAVGTNGQVLTADSTAATGLAWATASGGSTNVAGKNFIINGGMQVWQRGTSFTSNSSATNYAADRWNCQSNAATTFSRQATGDTTNLPFIQYCLRAQRNSGATGTDWVNIAYSMETVNSIPLAGKTVTLSFYARKGANFNDGTAALYVSLLSGTGTDQNSLAGYTGNATVATTNPSLTTTWQRFSITGTVGATATEVGINASFRGAGTAGAADYWEITGVQLEIASSASAYSNSASTYALELAACQRYFANVVPSTADYGTVISMFQATSGSTAKGGIRFPVPMRTSASIILANANNFTLANSAYTPIGGSSFTYALGNTVDCRIDMSVASGLVAGNATALSGNTANLLIQASAEL
jgi:hypothetical protein